MNREFKFNNEMYKTVGKNIKKYRKLKNLSLKKLSEYADIKEDFLNDFENLQDNLIISIYDLYKISVILEVSINKFFE